VTSVDWFEPGRSNLRDIAFHGGGGTDFAPLLREAERHAPDIGVFLTDLDGPADYRPAFPVLWWGSAASGLPLGLQIVDQVLQFGDDALHVVGVFAGDGVLHRLDQVH
jgi:predicted metal-dependent peptidase